MAAQAYPYVYLEGVEEFEITKFPAEVFSGDADFSGYDDEGIRP